MPEKAQRIQQVINSAIRIYGSSLGLLAEFLALGIIDYGKVSIIGGGQSQQLLEVNLPGSGVDQVGTAHDMGNSLEGIIDNDRQLIGKKFVPAQDNKIADIALELLLVAPLYRILKSN